MIFRCEIGEKKKTVVFDAHAYDGDVPIGRSTKDSRISQTLKCKRVISLVDNVN